MRVFGNVTRADRRATPCRGAVPVETEAQNPPKMSYQRGFFCDLSHDNGGRHPPRAKCLSFAVYPQARVAVPVFDDRYLSRLRKVSTRLNSPGTSSYWNDAAAVLESVRCGSLGSRAE